MTFLKRVKTHVAIAASYYGIPMDATTQRNAVDLTRLVITLFETEFSLRSASHEP